MGDERAPRAAPTPNTALSRRLTPSHASTSTLEVRSGQSRTISRQSRAISRLLQLRPCGGGVVVLSVPLAGPVPTEEKRHVAKKKYAPRRPSGPPRTAPAAAPPSASEAGLRHECANVRGGKAVLCRVRAPREHRGYEYSEYSEYSGVRSTTREGVSSRSLAGTDERVFSLLRPAACWNTGPRLPLLGHEIRPRGGARAPVRAPAERQHTRRRCPPSRNSAAAATSEPCIESVPAWALGRLRDSGEGGPATHLASSSGGAPRCQRGRDYRIGQRGVQLVHILYPLMLCRA